MIVIQKGHFWAKEFRCTGAGNGEGCGAILLVEKNDIYITHGSEDRDHNGKLIHYRTFQCPECGMETDIPENIGLPFSPKEKDWSAYHIILEQAKKNKD